jgi:hypothetical protein
MNWRTAAAAGVLVSFVLATAPGRAFQVREPQALDALQSVPHFIADALM